MRLMIGVPVFTGMTGLSSARRPNKNPAGSLRRGSVFRDSLVDYSMILATTPAPPFSLLRKKSAPT